MSPSEPIRRRVARPWLSNSNTTRCPCRSMRKIDPSSATGERSYSDRSVSRKTKPLPDAGSYALMTPCIGFRPLSQWPALTTLPDLMQPVQTFTRLAEPFTNARTRWMFGFQRRLVRIWECDTLRPHDGCFPHISQTEAIGALLETTELLRTQRLSGVGRKPKVAKRPL